MYTSRQTTEETKCLVADSALLVSAQWRNKAVLHIRSINWQDEVRAETEGKAALRPHMQLNHNDYWDNKLSACMHNGDPVLLMAT